jgi:hypothetical protein
VSAWATILVTIAGLYLAESVRRKTRAEIEAQVAERRLAAYGAVWEKTKVVMTMREHAGMGVPTEADRRRLYDELTAWYFQEGNGMVLAEDTRNVYLTAKENLTSPDEKLKPRVLRERILALPPDAREEARGQASVRQFSLLRTSMRADLLVFTGPWGEPLNAEDRAFLDACGVRRWRRPWRPSPFKKRVDEE